MVERQTFNLVVEGSSPSSGVLYITLKKHGGQENKRQQKRKKDQEPGNTWSTRATNQIQDPGPEQYVQYFDGKQHGDTGHIATIRAKTIHIVVWSTKSVFHDVIVLEEHHRKCHGGNN